MTRAHKTEEQEDAIKRDLGRLCEPGKTYDSDLGALGCVLFKASQLFGESLIASRRAILKSRVDFFRSIRKSNANPRNRF